MITFRNSHNRISDSDYCKRYGLKLNSNIIFETDCTNDVQDGTIPFNKKEESYILNCPKNCLTCNDQGICSACFDHFYLIDGKCLECSSKCLKCQLNSYSCLECDTNINLSHFVENKIKFQLCQNCSIEGCNYCLYNRCFECEYPYI